ncbi:MAG: PKD domain-containing protein [Crocinitomicaceae bacterium]
MKKSLQLFFAFLLISISANAQCDATFTYSNIDCDSVYFEPQSFGPQFVYFWDFGDGNTSMNATPVNSYSAEGSYTVILTLQDTVAGCFQSQTAVVNINCGGVCNVNGAISHTLNSSNCEVQFVSTAFNGTPPYSYYWDFGDGDHSTISNPIHQYPNNSVWTPCLTITDANGCDTTICEVVNVLCTPQPCDASFSYSFASCDSVYFYPTSLGTQYSYNWDFNDGNSSTQENPLNYFTADGTYSVSLFIIDVVTGCQDIVTVPITIDCGTSCNVTGATATYVDSIDCTVNFISTAYGGTAPYTYFWQFGDGQTSSSANPTHNYAAQGAYTYTLTITDANGCDTTLYDYVQVACNQNACDASFAHTYFNCNGVYFQPVSSGLNYNYFWDFGDGNTSTSEVPSNTFTDGVYEVWLIITDTISNCTDSSSVWVTINCNTQCTVYGDFVFNQDPNNCNTQFTSTAWGGQAPYSYYWEFGDGGTSTQAHPNHTYPNQGVYTPCLTITDANNCDTTICYPFTSNCTYQPCDAQFTYSQIACDSFMFFPVSYGTQYSYDWNFGDGGSSTNATPVHSYASNGTYVVQLLLFDTINNCADQFFFTLIVDCNIPNCDLNGAISHYTDSVDCSTQFVSTAYAGTPPYSYLWDFGDGNVSTEAHPVHTYPNNTVYTPCLTITDANGCDTTICDVVQTSCNTVSCDAQFTFSYNDCNTVQFYPASVGLNFDYFWDFGDGNTSTEASPIHDFTDGVYVIYLYVTDSLSGCFDQMYLTIQVSCGSNCTVGGAITYNQDFNSCDTYFASSPYGGQAPYTYFWDFGDGNTSTDANPVHAYPNGSTWTPCLTITDANGCDTTLCMVVNSQCSPPQCDPTFTWTHIGCDSLYFVPVASGSGMTYLWNFGDGTTSTEQNPTHTFTDGVHTVYLAITDTLFNCFNQTAYTIVIDCGYTPCNVNGAFNATTDPNCYTQFVSTAYGGTAPYSYFWDFGDGNTSTDAHPFHYYPPFTTWQPCLTITDANGCDTTICDVFVSQCNPNSCDAQFTYTYQDCQTIIFYPVSVGPQYSYHWDFGDGNTSTDDNPGYTYSSDGVYTVVLTLIDSVAGCQDVFTAQVTVACGNNCTVTGDFTYTMNFNNCEVAYYSQAFGGQAPYSYLWDFGDGTTSNQANPVHQYPGGANPYQVCLTIFDANGCDSTYCQWVTTNCPDPACNATFNPVFIDCDSVWFLPSLMDSSFDYFWDFGDGNTSTLMDPTHTYGANGTYTVVLTVSNSTSGCSDVFTQLLTVNCNATPCNVQGLFQWYSDSSQCDIHFVSSAWGGTAPYSYYWNFGDGGTSGVAHPIHTYAPGTWTPCVTITDANGCDTTFCDVVYSQCTNAIDETEAKDFKVYPNPTNGQFYIELFENASVRLYDLSGKLVLETNTDALGTTLIDISEFESGTYIISIVGEEQFRSKRIIKH